MRFTRVFLLLLSALPAACLDMPITQLAKNEGPVRVDAGDDADDLASACSACLKAADEPGPGCQTAFDACKQDAKCSVIIDCAFERRCFQGSRRAFLSCGLPCVTAGGVLTGDDPVLILASNLFQCSANGACGETCFSSE
jgi:hypothetical protein